MEVLNKFKNSNIDFYKKIPIIIDKFNDFLNDNEKTLSDKDFVDFYIDCLNFFKIKIIDITNEINSYIEEHPEVIDKDGDNKDNDDNFTHLCDIREEYTIVLDNLIYYRKNESSLNTLINKGREPVSV